MTRRKQPMIKRSETAESAFDSAKGDLESLTQEMTDWRDNMDGSGLENTSKFESVSTAADSLESGNGNMESVEIPESIKADTVEWTEFKHADARWRRLSNLLGAINAVKEHASEKADQLRSPAEGVAPNEDAAQELDEFVSSIEDVVSEIEGVDFPGMYG